MTDRLKDLVLAYLDKHPKCMGEYVFGFEFRAIEPPSAWKPESGGPNAFMFSPCLLLDPTEQTELVTHHSGLDGEMCCDRCAAFVGSLLGEDRAPREAEWAPALRAMAEAIGWVSRP